MLLFKVLFRIKVYGKENIPKKGGFILASNHVSYLDPVALGVACPRKLSFMAKADLFAHPLVTKYFLAIEVFPVKKDSADKSALKEAIKRLSHGKGVAIFPEGARIFEGKSSHALPGVGFLATKVNVPVIPAFIKGTDLALPRRAKFIRPHKISVYFGKEIPIERGLPYSEIADEILRSIWHLSC